MTDNNGCSDGLPIFPVQGKTIHPVHLQGMQVPERLWALDGWIPHGCVTGLYGDGGVGKSLLAMMLMTCMAQGLPFLGIPVKPTKVFGFFCEDTEDELHRRQNDINRHYIQNFENLGNMAWQSRVGCDNILMTFKQGKGEPTPTYHALREELLAFGATFAIIDTAADTFGGNEISRQEVRQYINLLGKLAQDIGGSVLLCAHPSVAGLANNSGSGGSTAWSNTMRSRLYLRRPIKKDGKDDDEMTDEEAQGLRELVSMKSNYGRTGHTKSLRWEEGVFVCKDAEINDMVSQIEKGVRDKNDELIFLTTLDMLTKQGRNVSESPRAQNYAPRVMEGIFGVNISKRRLKDAMERLFHSRHIEMGAFGKSADRKTLRGIVRKTEPD